MKDDKLDVMRGGEFGISNLQYNSRRKFTRFPSRGLQGNLAASLTWYRFCSTPERLAGFHILLRIKVYVYMVKIFLHDLHIN